MDLGAVMDEVAERLDTIPGLRTFGYPPPTLSAPAAIVSYPEEIDFDAGYSRGSDRWTLPVLVVVGRPTDRSTRDRVSGYCRGSGAGSVKHVLESHTWTTLDTIRVAKIVFDAVEIGGSDYLAAMFTLDISGPGA